MQRKGMEPRENQMSWMSWVLVALALALVITGIVGAVKVAQGYMEDGAKLMLLGWVPLALYLWFKGGKGSSSKDMT